MLKTKIIATLGPASSSETVLRKMFIAGLDTVRLNFSHGTTLEHIQRLELVRALNKKMRRHIKIMQDLEGYRIRIGKLKNEIPLKKRQTFYLTQKNIVGDQTQASFDYDGSLRGIKKGSMIYIDDGRIGLRVEKVEKNRLKTQVVADGLLKSNKGINIIGAQLEFPAMTDKDKCDVQVAIKYKVDYLAQSFVRSAADVLLLRKILGQHNAKCGIFAKVENPDALRNIDAIIKASDGIIVARGDLGICLPIYKVPVIQKELVKKCRLAGKPVVVATQMLESMINERIPTRAEVSDVANAILDGADYLLVSAETTIGKHPDKVVEMMTLIIKNTEDYAKKLAGLWE